MTPQMSDSVSTAVSDTKWCVVAAVLPCALAECSGVQRANRCVNCLKGRSERSRSALRLRGLSAAQGAGFYGLALGSCMLRFASCGVAFPNVGVYELATVRLIFVLRL